MENAGAIGIMATCDTTVPEERYGIVRTAMMWAIRAFVAARRSDIVLIISAHSKNDNDASVMLALSMTMRQCEVDRNSLIHFADYRGSPEHTATWLGHFPNTYFEVSFSAFRFTLEDQMPCLQGMHALESGRMLLGSEGTRHLHRR